VIYVQGNRFSNNVKSESSKFEKVVRYRYI